MAFIKKTSKDFDVIIGLDSSIDGDIISEGSVRIDGKVSGSVKSKGDVIIGDHAIVNADVEANYCEISGSVNGSVHSETQLKIFKSGKLNGDITVSSFTIEEGGIFQGNCDINPDKKDKKTPDKEKNNDSKNKEKNHKEHNNNNSNNKKTVS
ncbi:MAG: polymer-forming cytoskeletal protein [Clostridiales bacterium]|nr:polymer-forming cytoskeletal protein [Clostridiales bacterium]